MSKAQDDIEMLRSVASRLGWAEQLRPNGGWLLIAPEPNSTVHLPLPGPKTRSLRRDFIRQSLRKVMKYADPLQRAAFIAGNKNLLEDWRIDWSKWDFGPPRPKYELVPPRPVANETKEPESEQEQEQVEAAPEVETADAGADETHIVFEQPYLSHRAPSAIGGFRYASRAIIERRWSDGSIDYKCSRCEFTSENPRGVSTHYGRSSDRTHPPVGEDSQQEGLVRDREYTEAVLDRQRARVTRWKNRLEAAMAGLDRDSEEFSERLAERLVEQTDESSDSSSERVPPTAEQIVERVRRLVDGGAYLAAQERALELENELAEARAQCAATQKVVENFRIIAEMMQMETGL